MRNPQPRAEVVARPALLILRCGLKVWLSPGDVLLTAERSYGTLFEGVRRRVLQ